MIMDSLNNLASRKKVKTIEKFDMGSGKSKLVGEVHFDKDGKLERDATYDLWSFERRYYSYFGDTTLVRNIRTNDNPNGSTYILTLQKFDAAHQEISTCIEGFDAIEDSMLTPQKNCLKNYYKEGLKTLTTEGDATVNYSYDSHGNLIEIKFPSNVIKYRYIYQDGRITEVYSTLDNSPEYLNFKCSYNAQGLISKREDISSTTYEYDEDCRLIKDISDCHENKYRYDSAGRLESHSSFFLCEDYVEVHFYDYDLEGLLSSYSTTMASKTTGSDEMEKFEYKYTYWNN